MHRFSDYNFTSGYPEYLVKKFSKDSEGISDEELIKSYREVRLSQNAHSASLGFIALACYIGFYRKQPFIKCIPVFLDLMVAMGVDSLKSFKEYCNILKEVDTQQMKSINTLKKNQNVFIR